MDVTNVTGSNGMQYEFKTASAKKDKEKLENDPNRKDLGVIVEISKESEKALKMSQVIDERVHTHTRGKVSTVAHRLVHGNDVQGTMSFYGATVSKEQADILQSTIKELEEQGFIGATPDEEGNYQMGDEALGYSWEPGTYAQLGLKVSQLAYTCKKIGLSDDATEQITKTYGEQAQEKVNKVNGLIASLSKQIEVEKQKLNKMVEEHGENPYKTNTRASNTTGKESVELNREANQEVYDMFANLDISSADNFRSSFQSAIKNYQAYWLENPIETYTGTNRENMQIEVLVQRFNKYLSE